MGKVLKDSQGNILLANGGAIEITSAIDPNIQAGNIKSGVNILGVTGTYEGSGGGSGSGYPATTFYTGSSTIPGAKGGSKGGVVEPGPEPGTNITFYVSYPDNNSKVPDMFIVYDINKTLTNNHINYAILTTSQDLLDVYYGGNAGVYISITSLTSTIATLKFSSGMSVSFDPTQFQFAPIYLS